MPFVVVRPAVIHRIGKQKELLVVEPAQNSSAFGFYKEGATLPVLVRGRAVELESTASGFDRIQNSRRRSYKAGSWQNELHCSVGRVVAVKAMSEEEAMKELA